MKTLSIIISQALLIGCTLPAWGQGQASPAAANPAGPPLLGQPVRAMDIIGSGIRNSQNEKLGTVKDLALDLENGRLVEIIVARGGFLGLDQKLVAVPPQDFNAGAGGSSLRLSLDKAKLDGAPAVDLSQWSESMKQARVEEVYQYFGERPYFLVPELLPKNAGRPVLHPLHEVERAGHLVHLSTLNYLDENIGKVEDLIVDLPAGRVVEVIIDSGQFLRVKDELSAVPPQALHFNADRDILRLDTTAAALAGAPHFSARDWPLIDREQAGQVYRAYNVVPYFLPFSLGGTTQNAGPSDEDVVASLDAVEQKADMNITIQVGEAIQRARRLSDEARHVNVNTVKGRVILTGMVADSSEKRRLGRIAARYAVSGSVDNQLEIRAEATSSLN